MLIPRFCILFASVLIVFSIAWSVEPGHAQGTRFFAGYYMFGYKFTGYSGVLGDIITINPVVSGHNFIAEWVMEVLEYQPYQFFLQIGYTKGWDTNYQLQYFCETVDLYSGAQLIFLGPVGSGWHAYYMAKPYDYGESQWEGEWRYYIDGARKYAQLLYPYIAVDQQVSVETTTSTIRIDGSHFKRLSYFANQDWVWRWIRWDEHVAIADPPYPPVVEVSDYEFYANGGG